MTIGSAYPELPRRPHVGKALQARRERLGKDQVELAVASVSLTLADVAGIEASRSVPARDYAQYTAALRKLGDQQ